MSIALIIPSYGHFDYVIKTVNSFFEHSPKDSICYIIDDASKNFPSDKERSSWPHHHLAPYDQSYEDVLSTPRHDHNIFAYRHTKHSGLTRSWNLGHLLADRSYWRAEYTICGNSDILFTPNWYVPLTKALKTHDLVGPVTNAPGRVFEQSITKFLRPYTVSDARDDLASTAQILHDYYRDAVIDNRRINGFFMMAKTESWWENAYDDNYVFKPTANMVDVAYEVQNRFTRNKKKIGIVPSSFIFHYRSISRGQIGTLGACGKGYLRKKP